MTDGAKSIKCLNVIKRTFGDLTASAVTVEDATSVVTGGFSVDQQWVRIQETAQMFGSTALREALDWLAKTNSQKRSPFKPLGGRPVDLIFRNGSDVVAAYISDGTLYIFEDSSCQRVVKIAQTVRSRRAGRSDHSSSTVTCQRCGRDTQSGYGVCAACSGKGRSQINDQKGRSTRTVRPVDLGDTEE